MSVSKADEKSVIEYHIGILTNKRNNTYRMTKEDPPELKNLIEQLKTKKKKLEEHDNPNDFVVQIPHEHKLKEVQILDWLILDFIKMFEDATSLVLMRQPRWCQLQFQNV